jgi:SAM-dependent methyltransferase
MGWLRLPSEWVGPDGEVVGTDVDEGMLAAAEEFVDAEGLGNVVFVKDDLFESKLQASSFDPVHSRFEISPLARGAEQVATYCRLARPGGTIALEDWDKGCWHYNPPAPALEQLVGLIDQAVRRVSELDGGRTHLDVFTRVGIDADLQSEVLALPPGHPYLRLPIQVSTGVAPRLEDLVSTEELARLQSEAEAELRESGRWGTTFRLIQSWGKGDAMSTVAEQIRVDATAVAELQRSFRCELVLPEDEHYDERRTIWNSSIDRRPALIARCTGLADLISALRFARRSGLMIAVRGGIVIDLGPMKGIRVDPEARTAHALAGVLLGELDRETQALGLVVPGRQRHAHRPGRPDAGRRHRVGSCGPTASRSTSSCRRPVGSSAARSCRTRPCGRPYRRIFWS